MNQDEMKERTKDFAVRVIKLVAALPNNRVGDVLGRQLLKAGTSIGANYREARRASSRRHFITTMEIAQREADETHYWLELIEEVRLIDPQRLAAIKDECEQLPAIITQTIVSTKKRTTK